MLKMHSIEIFTRNSTAHHILENLLQHFLCNVLNFHGNMLLQLLMVAGGVAKILFF